MSLCQLVIALRFMLLSINYTGRYYIKKFLADWFQLEIEEVAPYLTIFEQDGAIDHLFRVTCGLDSMVVGETQILGQIKDSF